MASRCAAEPTVQTHGESELRIEWPVEGGDLLVDCRPDAFSVVSRGDVPRWSLDLTWDPDRAAPDLVLAPGEIRCRHEGHAYAVRLLRGKAETREHAIRLVPQDGCIVLDMSARTT